ncbi:ABC transporter transmembrane domain-containing protein [Propionibacteriaceae bacterium G1746]|uniref:ABC transporter transmembrane domain-containing protein n=1 Tax=Aestuariimicrobium sp. G57 TaxID=3418485 RepID=UPI003C22F87E
MSPREADDGALPPVFSGSRRRTLALLVGVGAAQAVLTVATALLTPRLMTYGDLAGVPVGLLAGLVVAALLIGLARVAERMLAERLGQDYVREVRGLLIASALTPGRGPNLGITVARTTNDLTALKNWVSLGVGPLAVGIPLIGGVVLALLVLVPLMGLAVLAVLLVFGLLLVVLAGPALKRARRLRKVRGTMAAHIADTVSAGRSIRVAGGVRRELRHVDELSEKVSSAALERAAVSGVIRGSAASFAAVIGVLVVVVGVAGGSSPQAVTAAILVAGMLATPVNDLARVSEYRQNERAAAKVLAPELVRARRAVDDRRRRARARVRQAHRGNHPGLARGAVHVTGLRDGHGTIPGLVAAPGSRVLLVSDLTERVEQVVDHLVGDRQDSLAWVEVAGRHIGDLPDAERRALVGVASRAGLLGRGTIARLVRYRVPDSSAPAMEHLARVGLDEVVAALPEGERTTLRRGGEPLDPDGRARLQLARAIAGNPPLLVIDHLDDLLAPAGRWMLRQVLRDYPGAVVMRTNDPEELCETYDVWNLDDLSGRVVARPAVVAAQLPRASTHVSGSGAPVFGATPERMAVAAVGSGTADVDEELELDG